MTPIAPLMLFVLAAAPALMAWRFGCRGAAWIVLMPAALLFVLWLALFSYWIDHTGDDDAETVLAVMLIWLIVAGGGALLGVVLRRFVRP